MAWELANGEYIDTVQGVYRQTIFNTRIVKVGDSTVIMAWELANGEYIDTVQGRGTYIGEYKR